MNFFEKMCENLAKNAEFFVEKCKNSRNFSLNSRNLNSQILEKNSQILFLNSRTFLNLRKLKNVLA